MKNLTHNQCKPKQSLLDSLQSKLLAQYQTADQNERTAIIRQIEAFLTIARSEVEKNFWLKFRKELENRIKKQEK